LLRNEHRPCFSLGAKRVAVPVDLDAVRRDLGALLFDGGGLYGTSGQEPDAALRDVDDAVRRPFSPFPFEHDVPFEVEGLEVARRCEGGVRPLRLRVSAVGSNADVAGGASGRGATTGDLE